MLFAASALEEQIELYSREWRREFIECGAFHIDSIYLPAIRANRETLWEMKWVLALGNIEEVIRGTF